MFSFSFLCNCQPTINLSHMKLCCVNGAAYGCKSSCACDKQKTGTTMSIVCTYTPLFPATDCASDL